MSKIKTITEHDSLVREVAVVREPTGGTPTERTRWAAGCGGVTRIVTYPEPGDGAYVAWLCIMMDDGSEIRAAARHYEVHFFAVEPPRP